MNIKPKKKVTLTQQSVKDFYDLSPEKQLDWAMDLLNGMSPGPEEPSKSEKD